MYDNQFVTLNQVYSNGGDFDPSQNVVRYPLHVQRRTYFFRSARRTFLNAPKLHLYPGDLRNKAKLVFMFKFSVSFILVDNSVVLIFAGGGQRHC